MATEQVIPLSVASLVEDVLHQHGARTKQLDLASRKTEEACMLHFFFFFFPP